MTRPQMHEFFRQFAWDPMAASGNETEEYVYDSIKVDAYFDRHQSQKKLHFAIILDSAVIGDIYIKNTDPNSRSCGIGIYIAQESCRSKGYGTPAEQMMLEYIFSETIIETVYADTLIKNIRSQRALEKAGFVRTGADSEKYYYECCKGSWEAHQSAQKHPSRP